MTPNEINDRIAYIRSSAHDPERAHSEEDSLYLDFICYVAACDLGSISEKANKILSTQDIKFPRWCA